MNKKPKIDYEFEDIEAMETKELAVLYRSLEKISGSIQFQLDDSEARIIEGEKIDLRWRARAKGAARLTVRNMGPNMQGFKDGRNGGHQMVD